MMGLGIGVGGVGVGVGQNEGLGGGGGDRELHELTINVELGRDGFMDDFFSEVG